MSPAGRNCPRTWSGPRRDAWNPVRILNCGEAFSSSYFCSSLNPPWLLSFRFLFLLMADSSLAAVFELDRQILQAFSRRCLRGHAGSGSADEQIGR